MNEYTFRLVNSGDATFKPDPEMLRRRPASRPEGEDDHQSPLEKDAESFEPGIDLETAINTAIAVDAPLLITGEPGTGKTTAAYYAAKKLDLGSVLHFQVKSETSATDLLYRFNTVRYFHAAHLAGARKEKIPEKVEFREKGMLWQALLSDCPRVLLIDEIDKAPRDFPNDLLHELHEWRFTCTETGEKVQGNRDSRPIVFITSNSERRLPAPFLRRCVYHHIRFDRKLAMKVALKRRKSEYPVLHEDFLEMAVDRFLRLRDQELRKDPTNGELLVWLRLLGLQNESHPELGRDLKDLPYLDVLIKDHQDMEELKKKFG